LAEVQVVAGAHLADRQTTYTIDVIGEDGRVWRIGEATRLVGVEKMVEYNAHAIATEATVKKVVFTLEAGHTDVTLGKIRFVQRA
jgi:hypothetical protein